MKSERQEAKEREKAIEYARLLYEEGISKSSAAHRMGMSLGGLENLRKKYIPNEFEKALKDGNLDPGNWNHAWLKSEGVSIHVRNKQDIVTYEEIRDEMIEAMKAHAPKYPKIERKKLEEEYLFIADIADPHFGKGTADYSLEIAEQRVIDGIAGLLQKIQGFNIGKILLIAGNDALHIDSPHRKTTSGTPQDTDGQWHEAFTLARRVYVSLIELLLPIADVHFVFNPSNHDYMSGFMLADSIASWFHNCPNITFDADMRHRKYFRYGNSLIGTTHGDGAKEKDLAKLMATEAKDLWAATAFRYWYCHHYHHKIAKDDIGVCIEYLRSPTSADRWHDDNGYITQPAVEGFLHSQDRGQIARLTHYC